MSVRNLLHENTLPRPYVNAVEGMLEDAFEHDSVTTI